MFVVAVLVPGSVRLTADGIVIVDVVVLTLEVDTGLLGIELELEVA